MNAPPPASPPGAPPPAGIPEPPPGPSHGGLRGLLLPRLAEMRARIRDGARHHRAALWPLVPVLLLCILSAPLLGAWIRWVELPRMVRAADLQPCAEAAAAASGSAARTEDATADAIVGGLDAQETALAPRDCVGMHRIDTGAGLRTAAYRFADGSLFTLHLRAPPMAMTRSDAGRGMAAEAAAGGAADIATDAPAQRLAEPVTAANTETATGIATGNGTQTAIGPADAGAGAEAEAAPTPADARPAPPAPPPILAATCPVQSRQSLLVLAGLLMVGVVVVLHRLRAGGKFFDFRNIVSEPLRPGEALLLLYAFTVMLGTGIGLQFGGCEAAEHREAVRVDATHGQTLQGLMTPTKR